LQTHHHRSLVISCEHAGNEVPPDYAAHFEGFGPLLQSHRGWDPGAHELALQMGAAFGVPVYASTTTRLLVDLNRSIGHRQLYSEVSRPLTPAQRKAIVARHYRPHRDAVEGEVARLIASGRRVLHIASHSFTPTLQGVDRNTDVAWLYDPRSPGELGFARDWLRALRQRAPTLRLRRNHPYQGREDGLNSCLRRRHGMTDYLGVELEVNHAYSLQGGPAWTQLKSDLLASLAACLAPS